MDRGHCSSDGAYLWMHGPVRRGKEGPYRERDKTESVIASERRIPGCVFVHNSSRVWCPRCTVSGASWWARRSREAALCLFQVQRHEADDPELASGGPIRQGAIQRRVGQETHNRVRVGWHHARSGGLGPLLPCYALWWQEAAVQRMDQVGQE